MSTTTSIQWTDVVDNIIVAEMGGWWCRMISEGCANCYAAKLNQSDYFGGNHLPYSGKPPELRLRIDLIEGWARQTKPKKHFVASMTDVFGDWVPYEWARTFLRGMAAAPRQTFQVLTKRPEIAAHYIKRWLVEEGLQEVPGNIWVGTSVENQQRADERIPLLLSIPAKVRFLSLEPLLGPIMLPLKHYAFPRHIDRSGNAHGSTTNLQWVIVGGESGPKARKCAINWIASLVEQCQASGVPCFVKQLGSLPFYYVGSYEGEYVHKLELSHPKGGDMDEWPKHLQVRQFPST